MMTRTETPAAFVVKSPGEDERFPTFDDAERAAKAKCRQLGADVRIKRDGAVLACVRPNGIGGCYVDLTIQGCAFA